MNEEEIVDLATALHFVGAFNKCRLNLFADIKCGPAGTILCLSQVVFGVFPCKSPF
jgi:hypothetical protein